MKKINKTIIILFMIMSTLLLMCLLLGCDFVSYVDTANTQTVSEEIVVLRKSYEDKLYAATAEIKFRDKEQKLFDYAMQDAINELNECISEDELNKVYDKHFAIIDEIKTDEEYLEEEETAAINAYRTAVVTQAEKSYDKSKYGSEQVTYLNAVFAEFKDGILQTDDTEEMDALLQNFYFDIHKENEILTLIDYADITKYDESQKTALTEILNACIESIRGCDKDEAISGAQELYKYAIYKIDTVNKIKEYVDLTLYRKEQVNEIEKIKDEYIALAEKATSKTESDNVFREYQITLYNIPTDELLYNEELNILKEELYNALTDSYKLSYYDESQTITVNQLFQQYLEMAASVTQKEDVLSQYIIIRNRLDSVKTKEDIAEEERIKLIEELYTDLLNRVEQNADGLDKNVILRRAQQAYADMKDRVSLSGVREVYIASMHDISPRYALRFDLQEYNNEVYYRESEKKEVDLIKKEYLSRMTDSMSIDETRSIFEEAKRAIDVIKTNDDLWNDSVEAFRTELHSRYGDAILEEPRSLIEANDYSELANIIDYYAFYQLSVDEFVCDTFRVKLNFEHNDAWTELVNVYWYCELIRTAVGIDAYFENNSDYLVFILTPYNFASTTNDIPNVKKTDSLVEFDSDKSQFVSRSEDFDDFGYYSYARTIKVWNSQQLWYALEHEYIPVCVPDSPAEKVINRAKEILRDIIMEGMTEEEKIFQIYTWFGRNGRYDSNYKKHSDNAELSCQMRSYHVEGALFDKLGICYSYAKAFLLLARIEGVETYYIFGSNGSDKIDYNVTQHGYNYFKVNNNWFLCDPVRSFWGSPSDRMATYEYFMLPAINYHDRFLGITKICVHKDIDKLILDEAYVDWSIYQSFKVNNANAFVTDVSDLKVKISNFIDGTTACFSLFCDKGNIDSVVDYLISYCQEYNFNYNIVKLADNAVAEILVIKEENS